MELRYRNSFYRDLDKIANRELRREIEKLILRISHAHVVSSIPRMKQLRNCNIYEYKIELRVQTKKYWILCDVHSTRIIFTRIKSESWCKANL